MPVRTAAVKSASNRQNAPHSCLFRHIGYNGLSLTTIKDCTMKPLNKLHLLLALLISLTLMLPVFAADEKALISKVKKVRIKTPFRYPRKPTSATLEKSSLTQLHSPRTTAKKNLSHKRPMATTDSAYHILEQTVLSVDYLDMSLEQVIDDLRERLKINILVYWPQMNLAGYSRDDAITLQLNGVRAETVLESVLNYASASQQQPLDFDVDRGVVTINLREHLPERKIVAVYYIGDLMQKRSDHLDTDLGIGDDSGSSNQSRNSSGSSGSSRNNSNSRSR